MFKKSFLLVSLLTVCLSACGTSQSGPKPTPQPEASTISGTVFAPAEQDVANTVVAACYFTNGTCDEAKTKMMTVTASGASATFKLTGLEDFAYIMVAAKDVNGNGAFTDTGDFSAELPGAVTPPRAGLELHMAVVGGTDPGPVNAEPHTVTGVALDTQGRPINGALVWIEPALTTGLVTAHTDSSGTYKVTGLIDVPYYAKAWTEVDYGGEHYCLRLGMPNASDFDSFVPSEGAVRNFRWQLTGVIEDLKDYDGYFGGEIRLFREGDMKNGTVELTFTPKGPLADGSTVAAFTRTLNVNDGLFIYDIPLGMYTVTSVLIEADGTRTPLKTGVTSAYDGYDAQTDAADLAFKPNGCGNDNGLERAFLYLNSPYEY